MAGQACRRGWIPSAAFCVLAALTVSVPATAQVNGTNGQVLALEIVEENGVPVLWVGGGFTQAGGVARPFLARYQMHGNGWSDVPGGRPNGGVNTLGWLPVAGEAALYIGGDFTAIDRTGVPDLDANRIVRWLDDEFFALGNGLNGFGGSGTDANAKTLALFGGDLIVGGRFRGAESFDSFGLARWDGSAWFALDDSRLTNPGWADLSPSAGGGTVHSLANVGGQLLIGADRILRLPRPECDGTAEPFGGGVIASWNGSQYSELGVRDPTGSPNPSCGATGPTNNTGGQLAVRSIAEQPGGVFVGGQFQVALQQRFESQFGPAVPQLNNVSRLDGDRFLSLPGGPEADQIGMLGPGGADVRAIVSAQGGQYFAGRFSSSGFTPPQTLSNVARLDGDQWAPLVDADTGQQGFDGIVEVALRDPLSGDVYFGGSFTTAGGKAANRIVRWDGRRFHPLGNPSRGIDGLVRGEGPGLDAPEGPPPQAFVGADVFITGHVARLDEQVLKDRQRAFVVAAAGDKDYTVQVENLDSVPHQIFLKLVNRPNTYAVQLITTGQTLVDLSQPDQVLSLGTVNPGQNLSIPLRMRASGTSLGLFPAYREQADLLLGTSPQLVLPDGEIAADDIVRLVALDDCNANQLADQIEADFALALGTRLDLDSDQVLDSCEISRNPALDADGNGVLDEVEAALEAWDFQFLQVDTDHLPVFPSAAIAGDFNGDGFDDLITRIETGGQLQLTRRHGSAAGLDAAIPLFDYPPGFGDCGEDLVVDVDGDGILDLLIFLCERDTEGNIIDLRIFALLSRDPPGDPPRQVAQGLQAAAFQAIFVPIIAQQGALPDLYYVLPISLLDTDPGTALELQRLPNLGLDGNDQLIGFGAEQTVAQGPAQPDEQIAALLAMNLIQPGPAGQDLLLQTTQRNVVFANTAGDLLRRANLPARQDPDELPERNPHRKPGGSPIRADLNGDGIDELIELVRDERQVGGQSVLTDRVRITDGRALDPDSPGNANAQAMVFDVRFNPPLYNLNDGSAVSNVCLDFPSHPFFIPLGLARDVIVTATVNGQTVQGAVGGLFGDDGFVGLNFNAGQGPGRGQRGPLPTASLIRYLDVDGDGRAERVELDPQQMQLRVARAVGEVIFGDGFED